jgi:hypothetical protein
MRGSSEHAAACRIGIGTNMEATMADQRQDQGSQPSGTTGEQDGGTARPSQRQGDEGETPSALGGGTATRSSTASGPDPAED